MAEEPKNEQKGSQLGMMLRDQKTQKTLQALLQCDQAGLYNYVAQALGVVFRTPTLVGAARQNPAQLLVAIKNAAAAQLSLDPALGQMYLVPYKGKIEAQMGYKGVNVLALRSGRYTHIDKRTVWRWDDWELTRGTEESLFHRPARHLPEDAKFDENDIVATYALAHLKDSDRRILYWCPRLEILAARARSPAYRRFLERGTPTPWVTDFAAMAEKTAVHRLGKLLELSPRDMRTVLRELEMEAGKDVPPREVEIEDATPIDALEDMLSRPLPNTEGADEAQADLDGAQEVSPRDPPGGARPPREVEVERVEAPSGDELFQGGTLKRDGGGPRQ